jgi:hypothetical protein
MNKLKMRLFFFCSFLCIPVGLLAQEGQLLEIQAKFQDYAVRHLQEKIFVHTDKDFYLTGETLWFKIYDVDGTFHKPMAINKIAYVEIISNEKLAVIQTKIDMDNGTGHGSLKLPEVLPGNYTLRAYTRWMRNYGPSVFFEKVITIADPRQTPEFSKTGTVSPIEIDLQFFPEGGSLVYSLTSKVGFKITDQHGKGIPCDGAIINEKNDTLVNFSSLKFGMGSFLFSPIKDHTYKAVIDVNGKNFFARLPGIENEGYVMKLTPDSDKLRVKVNYAGSRQPKMVFLLAHTRQFLKVAEIGIIHNNEAEFQIPKINVGDGITHFTILDENKIPVCERLFFKKPERKMAIETLVVKNKFSPRESVDLNIFTRNGDKNVASNLSLSVFMVDSLQVADAEQISTYLFLSSDLKGRICPRMLKLLRLPIT